jgi:carboxypeptidase Q
MKRLFSGLLAALLCVATDTAAAEVTPPLATADALLKVRDTALASDYALRETAALTDGIGPRLSGSAGAAAAVQQVAEALRQLGLEVRLEPVKVPHWVRGVELAQLTDWPGHVGSLQQKIAVTALGGSVATPQKGLIAPVVVVRDYTQLEALGTAGVRGRIVLFAAAFDEAMNAAGHPDAAYSKAVDYRANGASRAAALGAVAALNRSAGPMTGRTPHTGALHYADGVVKIPAGAVSAEDALLIERLATQGSVRMQLTLTPQTLPDADSFNVVADLKGRERPDEVVVVSGHLDSWDLGTGAQDDATGVAAAMQVAEAFQKSGLRPRRTLRVIAWMNEENGLMGGKTYAAQHAAELDHHQASIEMDIGAGHPTGIIANVTPETLPLLQPVADTLKDIGAGIVEHALHSVGADIGPMAKAGVPDFAPQTDGRAYFAIHHTAADTFDKINSRYLAENATVLAVLAFALADGPALPRLPAAP